MQRSSSCEQKEPDAMKGSPITQAEIIELFGDAIPLQAVRLIVDMPAGMTFEDVREQLHTIARARSASPSHAASLLLSLHQRHLQATRDGDDETRDRLDNLISEFEWAFPETAAELKAVFARQGGNE